jgi:hypothetical protein
MSAVMSEFSAADAVVVPALNSGILGRFDLFQVSGKTPRPVGRPRTRTPEYLAGLMRDHAAMTDWFQMSHGRAAKSDAELLNAFLANEFQKHGMRAARIQSPEVQAHIKTIRNHLSEARRHFSAIPETPLFPGRNTNHINAY